MLVVKQLLVSSDLNIKFVFRNFPFASLHPLAIEAALVAEAAGLQGYFWEMHEMILKNQKYLNRSSFNRFAEEIGIDIVSFDLDCQRKQLFQKVSSDFESGIRSGVSSTPTFFVNGLRYNGFDDYQSLYRICKYSIVSKEENQRQALLEV
jgi:protein-disulfide isomerase